VRVFFCCFCCFLPGSDAGSFENHPKDPFDILDDIVVPEAQHTITLGFEKGGSASISGFIMLAAIEFDDQPRFDTKKVDDEGADTGLSSELQIAKLAIPDGVPKSAFDVGRVSPESCGMGAGLAADRVHLRDYMKKKTLTQPSPMKMGEGLPALS
jgi:hypothetical protein